MIEKPSQGFITRGGIDTFSLGTGNPNTIPSPTRIGASAPINPYINIKLQALSPHVSQFAK
jgi:hypothetical protein